MSSFDFVLGILGKFTTDLNWEMAQNGETTYTEDHLGYSMKNGYVGIKNGPKFWGIFQESR